MTNKNVAFSTYALFMSSLNICISELLLKPRWRQLKADLSYVTELPHLPDPHLVCTKSIPVLIYTSMSRTYFNALYSFKLQTSLSLREHLLHSGDQAAQIMTAIIGTYKNVSITMSFITSNISCMAKESCFPEPLIYPCVHNIVLNVTVQNIHSQNL